jgi:hydrogenase nickel incorporation protein HypB
MTDRRIYIGTSVTAPNDEVAAQNRRAFEERNLLAVNVMSSPGSGKTTLIEAMAGVLRDRMAVIVGDVQTRRDAERIEATGCPVHQIETGGACHLDARRVAVAMKQLDLPSLDCRIVVIENVGNLVCPASFDLGEHMKAALLSPPEGDDKVLKYPALFTRITALIITKLDLLPHMEFDVERVVRECASLNDDFETFKLSARTGEGVGEFCEFLLANQSALTA